MTKQLQDLIRVLIFPAGTEIGLEIQKALQGCKDIELIAGGVANSHAPFVFSSHREIPNINEKNWFERLQEIIVQDNISCIFPAHDEAVTILSRRSSELKIPVITSPAATCEIARSKSKTYQTLKDVIPVPYIYSSFDEVKTFPVFIKPDRAQGSYGAQIVDSQSAAQGIDTNGKIIIEYLPGDEFTIDCMSDRERGLLFCGGRVRKRIKCGISVRTEPVQNPLFWEYARDISKLIPFHGAWFFQLKENAQNQLTLLEIAPRIAGAMACYRVQGINFSYLSLLEAFRKPFSISLVTELSSVILDRALINRYKSDLTYDSVYFDLDDTLIFKGKVHLTAIKFIFQCINKKIPVFLLTRHNHNVENTLLLHKLNGLFDRIIHVTDKAPKSCFIIGKNPIFIDDSFGERLEVSTKLKIPTFDLSMIESLLDDRT